MNKNLAYALEWYLRGLGKIENSNVCTAEGEVKTPFGIMGDGEFKITKWEVDGVKVPKEEELTQIIADYESHLVEKESAEATKKEALLTKLGLTEEELKTLAEILK